MSEAAKVRAHGLRFDQVAAAYDEHRRTYPDEIIDVACNAAGLQSGDPVLEVGCVTGQLTAALVDRGFVVVAVDPGPNMSRLELGSAGTPPISCADGSRMLCFPAERFAAIFSAPAFHWVDPRGGLAERQHRCCNREERSR